MKKVIGCFLAALVLSVGLLFAQATPSQSLAWDAPNAVNESVTRFEVKYDGGAYVNAGLTGVPGQPGKYYHPLPALSSGSHSVVVRACNVAGCSADSTPFNFSYVAGVPTVIPGNSITIIVTP